MGNGTRREFRSQTENDESLCDFRYGLDESLCDFRYELDESLCDFRYEVKINAK